ncbi:unnamed protein product [Brassica rapa]|uniref:Uncharacterized protein n=2 Tax=Brassica TaxID=3705 RepID=A0A3P6AA75_BRACM|nr:unnamed protein product [Brassica napus]CAG7885371.1 unnamed protein product [Brassica rapa]CDY29563.1 BnaA03g54080D [Brassica napus]VDC84364.1 unnamed protein product [Brassica rapa]
MMRPPLLRLPTRSIRDDWSCFCNEENLLALANTSTHLPDIIGQLTGSKSTIKIQRLQSSSLDPKVIVSAQKLLEVVILMLFDCWFFREMLICFYLFNYISNSLYNYV